MAEDRGFGVGFGGFNIIWWIIIILIIVCLLCPGFIGGVGFGCKD